MRDITITYKTHLIDPVNLRTSIMFCFRTWTTFLRRYVIVLRALTLLLRKYLFKCKPLTQCTTWSHKINNYWWEGETEYEPLTCYEYITGGKEKTEYDDVHSMNYITNLVPINLLQLEKSLAKGCTDHVWPLPPVVQFATGSPACHLCVSCEVLFQDYRANTEASCSTMF